MKTRALPILAACFGVLLCIRAIDVSSETLASAPDNKSMDLTQQSNTPVVPVQTESCLTSTMADTILESKAKLEEDLQALALREEGLNALEARINENLKTISDAKADIEKNVKRLNGVAESDLVHLVSMYETMKPKSAAEILNSMDPAFAAGFLREMNSTRAGLVMAQMKPQHSHKISVIIANRNAAWRKKKTN